MDNEERAALIRRGNELFNKKDIKNSLKIFLATDYKDGIARVADYLYYEEHQTISSIKLYKKAGLTRKVEDFAEKAALTIHLFLQEDEQAKQSEEKEELIVPVSESMSDKSEIQEENMETWTPIHIKSEEIMGQVIEGKGADEAIQKKKSKKDKK